jgi:DNA-binding transcriptional MerR regulator
MKAPQTPGTAYRIQEFARLAGVTVRALHHYDRLGLLKPLRRARSGYCLYRDSDLARLEQIVVLKFVGLPLADIGRLINRKSSLTYAREFPIRATRTGRLPSRSSAVSIPSLPSLWDFLP